MAAKTTKKAISSNIKNGSHVINARTSLKADLAALAEDAYYYYCENTDGCAYLSYDPSLCFDTEIPTPASLTPAQVNAYPTQITFFSEEDS